MINSSAASRERGQHAEGLHLPRAFRQECRASSAVHAFALAAMGIGGAPSAGQRAELMMQKAALLRGNGEGQAAGEAANLAKYAAAEASVAQTARACPSRTDGPVAQALSHRLHCAATTGS